MDQVSRPLLIALAATIALVAIWVVVLRPKPVAVENTPLVATKAVPQANQAAAISDAANAKAQAAANSAGEAAPAAPAQAPAAAPATTPPTAAAPKIAAAPKAAKRAVATRSDAAVLRDIKRGNIVVLLFWNAKAADDVATRGALRNLDRHDGRVVVRVIPISRVARYASVTKDVKIAGSPTTVVIGRKGRTRVIAGLTEPRELAQAVGDALAGR